MMSHNMSCLEFDTKLALSQLYLPIFRLYTLLFCADVCNGTMLEIPISLAPTTTTTTIATTTTTVPQTTPTEPPTTTSIDERKFKLVYESCEHPDECPRHSTCKPNSCEGYTCLCRHGYMSNDAHTECLKCEFMVL